MHYQSTFVIFYNTTKQANFYMVTIVLVVIIYLVFPLGLQVSGSSFLAWDVALRNGQSGPSGSSTGFFNREI